MKNLVLFFLLFSSFNLFSQFSPSGQVKVVSPSILSACSADTIFLEFTNQGGPSCVSTTGPAPEIQFEIQLPDTVNMNYQASSVGSLPSGAAEVSYTGGLLTLTAPTPSFGATTKVWFVLNATCNVTGLTPLPQLDITANYPAGFTIPTENWLSSKMNIGVGQLTTTLSSSSYVNTIAGFSQNLNQQTRVKNTGFGRISEVTYHAIIHDSLLGYIGGAGNSTNPRDHMYIAGANVPAGSVSRQMDTYPDYTIADMGIYRMVTLTIRGDDLDAVDGYLDPGDQINVNETYLKMPSTCADDMSVRTWFSYKCIGGSAPCAAPDTLYKTMKITAGLPIIAGVDGAIDVWDGQPNKSAAFNFKNNGVPDPARPEVSTAYDVDLSLTFLSTMYISNLNIAGTTAFPTNPATPATTNQIKLLIKDLLTTDIDGPGGLEDLDGDGFFDDLAPGEEIAVTFNYTVPADVAKGKNLNYQFRARSTFTDYCGKLNGSGNSLLYSFGFTQPQTLSQETPLPSMGSLSNGQIGTADACFTFRYAQTNIDLSQASMELVLNYNKTDQIIDTVKFLGQEITLESGAFTVLGTGFTAPTSAHVTTAADGANNTTDNDSALVYSLSAAEMAMIFDATPDELCYSMAHISCDSLQNQSNNNTWQLFYYHTPTATPIDLAGNKAFVYNITEGCGGKPCYNVVDRLYRESPIGFTDENETTQATPVAANETKFYTGDTLTYLKTFRLSSDYTVMEPIGFPSLNNNDLYTFRANIGISYSRKPGSMLDDTQSPFLFVPGISTITVTDTVTNTVIASVPLDFTHFYAWSGGFTNTTFPTTKDLGDNITDHPNYYAQPDINSVPGVGLGDYWCGNNSIPVDQAYCPYGDARYRSPGSNLHFAMQNDAETRATEYYHLVFEKAIEDAGIIFYPGYSKYRWDLKTKWVINKDFEQTNTDDFQFRSSLNRRGNGLSPAPSGTNMGSCNNPINLGTVLTKDIELSNGGATYAASCGLNISNSLEFNNSSGDFIPGEVRIPYKLDSMTVDLPAEYYTTATAPNLSGANGGPANSIEFNGTPQSGGFTGHVLFTNNTTNSGTSYPDFPRFSDADGNNVIWDVTYSLSNVGTDNFVTETYSVPIKYYLRDEFGDSFVYIDTFYIAESEPDISISPLGGPVQVEDGGTCGASYMDILVANNTLYAAANVFLAVEGTPNTTIVSIEDLNQVPDPIGTADTSFYNGNNLYAILGGVKPAEQRIVRVYFNTFACSDSIKIISNFGCNLPASSQPEYPSTTMDSAYIFYNSVPPSIMSSPIDGNKFIEDLCTNQTLEVEIRNVKNVNVYNAIAGIKLPPNAEYVVGSAQIAYPSTTFDAATVVTVVGTDSLSVDLMSDIHISPTCGILGADEGTNPLTVDGNVVKLRFDVEFTACPIGTSDEVVYAVTAENYCGTTTKSDGVFNILYTGSSTSNNVYSCKPANSSPIQICGDAGVPSNIVDSLNIVNFSGPASPLIDSLSMTIATDTNRFILSGFSAAAPWGAPNVDISAEGRTILSWAVPAGIPPSDSSLLVLNYTMTPKIDNLCFSSSQDCPEIAHSVSFYSAVTVSCPAKGLNCTSLGRIQKGAGYVPRELECCTQSIGDFVWLDTDNDGSSVGETGLGGIVVNLYDNGADGLPNTIDDTLIATTISGSAGDYLFDSIPSGNYHVEFDLPTNSNYEYTNQVNAGDNGINTNSDAGLLNGKTGTFVIVAGENELTVDGGLKIIPFPASDDFVTIDEDSVVTIDILGNDFDPNNNPLGPPTITSNGTNGTAVINPDGTLTYTPDPNFNGMDTITYAVCDSGVPVQCDTAIVVITIDPMNDAPTTTDVDVATSVDTPIGVNVGAGTSDPESNPLTYTYGTPTVPGTTVSVTGNGTVVVTPPPGFVGTIDIPYVVCDSSQFDTTVLCDSAIITVTVVDTVGGVNNPPLANEDLVTTSVDTPVTVNPLGNDFDPDADSLTVTTLPGGGPTNGTSVLNPDGTITYTPNPGFTGIDSTGYIICDPDGLCDTSYVIVTISPVVDEPNVAPIATDDYDTTPEDTPVTVSITNNDTDPNGTPLNPPTILSNGTNGTAVINPDGTLTYTPDPNFNGMDTITYVICDTAGMCDTAIVVITIDPMNDAPTTTDVDVATSVDTPIGVNVGAGTSDPENNPLTYTYGTPTVPGTTVSVTGNGTVVVTPPPGFVGTIDIPYVVCDSSQFDTTVLCDSAIITVTVVDTVGGVNNPPLANEDLVTTPVDTPVTVNPLGNDFDPDADSLTVTTLPGGGPTNGTSVLNPDGTITYTPNPGFTGIDSTGYIICDPDGLCDTSYVIVTISPVVDEPNVAPIATDDYDTTPEDTPVTVSITNNDTDPNGTPLNPPTILSNGTNGTAVINPDGTLTYTPDPNFNGMDTITYVICDTAGMCDTAIVVITIDPMNDAPTTTDVDVATSVDTPIGVNVGAGTSDPESNPLTYTYGTPTVPGTTVSVTGNGTVVVTPPPGFVGTIDIPYVVCDSSQFDTTVLCDSAIITVTIVDTVGGVNNPPLANEDLVTTSVDTPVTVNPLGNDYDLDGMNLTVSPLPGADPTNGTAVLNPDGTFTYTPNPGFIGVDSIGYIICDEDGLCDTSYIIITISPVVDEPNVAPIATDDYDTTPEDTPVTVSITNNDTDPNGTPLNPPTILSNGTNGTAVINPDGTLTYTPDPNFNGMDTITYVICDTAGMCDTAIVVITIDPMNDAPTTTDVDVATSVDTPIGVNVGAGTSDPESNPLTYTYGTPTVPGTTVSVTGNGTVVVTPPPGFVGTIDIPYVVCDSSQFDTTVLCDSAIITVTVVDTVGGVNNPPLANEDLVTTSVDTPVTVNPLGNDFDPDADSLTVTTLPGGGPTNGTSVLNPDGTITYTPNPGFTGIDSTGYIICDPDGLCDTSYVIVTISPVVDEPNVAPIATDDYDTTPEDTPVTVSITNNDTDPNGTPLNPPTILSNGTNGTAVINPDGTLTYTPDPNFNGMDTITYVICDTAGMCDTAIVVITIDPMNDAPTTTDVDVATSVDTPIGVNVGAGTSDPENNPLTYTYGTPTVPGTTVSVTGNGTVVVTPPPGFVGTIDIPYVVCDSSQFDTTVLCDSAIITVTVVDTVGGVNNPPLANEDLVTTPVDTPVTVNPLGNDFDPDADSLTVTTLPGGGPTNGTSVLNPDGTITYTPNPGFTGIDSTGYIICDPDGLCDTSYVIVTISPVVDEPNVAPIATDDYDTTPEDTPVTVSITNNDTDPNGTPLNPPTILSNGTNGTAVINPDGTLTYTPDPNFNGMDTITYVICDTAGMCDTAIVVITIDPMNDAPTTTDVDVATSVDTPIGVNVGAGTSDPESNPLTYTYGTPTVPGTTVSVTGNGTVVVTPPPGFVGTIDIPYVVCDSSQFDTTVLCDSAIITVTIVDTVGGVNNPPLANEDLVTTSVDTPVTVNPLGNDYDLDGMNLTVSPLPGADPTNGTAVLNPDGTFTYTPNPGFIGVDSIGYIICDEDGLCDTSYIIITISPVVDEPNVAPIATDDFGLTYEDVPITVFVASNDSDPNGNPLDDPTILTNPNNGTVTVNSDGSITYVPDPGFVGMDTFTYVICDMGTPVQCDTAVVIITVLPCLDNPNLDCDGDGVTNGDEIADGTDPTDPCDLVITSQTLTPSQDWLDADCDGDGISNGDEISGGSDPFDRCDPIACEIVMPQIITPDGDGKNDVFIVPNIKYLSKTNIKFYNRWGNVVYETSDYQNDWGGTTNVTLKVVGGEELPTGTYYYVFIATQNVNGVDEQVIKKGYVYVKR